MPLLITGLVNAIAWIYTFFQKSGIKRYALIAAAVTVVIAAFGVVKAAIVSLIAGAAVVAPDMLVTAMSWVAPYNVDDCIAIRVGAELAFMIYRWQHNIVLQAAINAQ